jgi:HK97 family phage major capsid protein
MIATKYTSGIVLVSNELLNDEIYGVEGELISAMGERFGRGLNEDCTIGTGTAEPEGLQPKVLTKSVVNGGKGLQSVAAGGITFDKLIDTQHSIDIAYRAKATWMMNDSSLRAIRKLKDGNGNYIWQAANARTAEPDLLFGRAITINTDMHDDATVGNLPVMYGDFKKGFRVRLVAGTVMRRLNERFAEADQVGFVGFRRYDSRVMRLSALTGIKIV